MLNNRRGMGKDNGGNNEKNITITHLYRPVPYTTLCCEVI